METQIIEQYMDYLKNRSLNKIEQPQTGEPERIAAELVARHPEHILRLATVMAGVVERNKRKKGGKK